MNRFYSRVTFIIEMKRKTGYYLISVILPCVMLVFMTLISFCLPPDSGEKVGLGVTIILAFSVYQIMIAESPPTTSDATPVLSEYTLCLALNQQRLGSINANIIHLHSYLTSNDETKAIQAEWKAAARVIGRLFFRLALVVAVMDTIILFAPQL
ncbi:hypothetical protein CAPTEDRAFT_120481 [Capitella teleta]|uniref:Neurotransmitter-gated ion-channel transmembrane domain-containing protein n=1 Tax=Capitella teleta TaxID=283909 RepID=R7TYA8_CAPTE|nr:hypothetical protein CAPTEDRAFT_120481 [Capitella teleta]|eukprot:ELT96406.1 hypothetical protein CAPTEDRAFT_120481 [Capitella teleta]